MTVLQRLGWLCIGAAVAMGYLSLLSLQFGGLGHIPRPSDLPGLGLTALLDRVPLSVSGLPFWPENFLGKLETLLDTYECPVGHEYRVEIVNHAPLILRFRGFLPYGDATHLLKLAYIPAPFQLNNRSAKTSDASSYVAGWTKNDPARTYLEPDEDRVVACLESRIANMSGYPIQHLEAIQVHNKRLILISDCEEWWKSKAGRS
jgi:hypothetical protein